MTNDRPARPPAATPPAERRYTEEDLALILNRAAELQEGVQPSTPRYTLADIQEIAAGAGIAREHVERVALSLGSKPARRETSVLGAPWKFRFDESIEGTIADDAVAELFELARRELGLQGRISEALGAIEWTAKDASGTTSVTVARRGGRTSISVLLARTDAAAVATTIGSTSAILGFLFLATLVGSAGLGGPLALLAGLGIGGGGSFLSTRLTWRRFARRYAEQTDTLGSELVAAARRAVEEGRTP